MDRKSVLAAASLARFASEVPARKGSSCGCLLLPLRSAATA